jgi:hypothetical protein
MRWENANKLKFGDRVYIDRRVREVSRVDVLGDRACIYFADGSSHAVGRLTLMYTEGW